MEAYHPPLIDEAVGKVSAVATYLQIPSAEIYYAALSQYSTDAWAWAKSSYHLTVLTLTPVIILCTLLFRVLGSVFMAIGGRTIQQFGRHAVWFVQVQRSLSAAEIAVELLVVATVVGVYLLRRYIRKRRYVERIRRWMRRHVVTRYQNAVRAVSKTSVLLALALPHLLYAVGVTAIHYAAPSVTKYLALHTPAIGVLTLWMPLVRTVLFLHRWTMKKRLDDAESKKKDDGGTAGTETENEAAAAGSGAKTRAARKKMTRSTTSRAADRYLEATMSKSTKKTKLDEEEAALREEGMELLKYWVVYALLCAVFRALALLPVVGGLVTAASPAATATSQSRWKPPPQPGRIGRMVSALRPTERLLKEVQLLFFGWLLCLPTSLTGAAVVDGVDARDERKTPLKHRVSEWEASIGSGDRNRPLNIVYRCFAPIVVSVADFSVQLTQEGRNQGGDWGNAGGGDDGSGGSNANATASTRTASSIVARLLGKAIGFARSVLQVTVFMKMISPATSDWILTAMADGAALLPAAITLLMPGYFTEFGVLYVSNVVPSANSTVARDKDDGGSMVRYLKYWVIHTLLSSLLGSLRPILAWVPLSTHVTWILWAYVQLEPITRRLHAFLERELTLFGLLHSFPDASGADGDANQGIDQTMTVKLFRKASSMLPNTSSKPTPTVGGEGEEKSDDEAASGEEEAAAAASTTAPADSELVRAKID